MSSSEISVVSLSDRHTLLLVGDQAAIKSLEPQLERDGRVRIRRLPGGRAELVMRAPTLVHAPSFADGVLRYEMVDRRQAIQRHLKTRTEAPLPNEYTYAYFQETESLIERGRLRQAEKALQRLSQRRELSEFARLRVADLEFLKGDRTSACAQYEQLVNGNKNSTTGTLAVLRLNAIACPGNQGDLGTWEALLEHVLRIGGRAGEALWKEAIWTMNVFDSPESMRMVLSLTEPYDSHGASSDSLPGVSQLRSEIVARVMLSSETPVELTENYLAFEELVARHRESLHLSLIAARAFLANGLPRRAAFLLESILAARDPDDAWNLRAGTSQALSLLVEAYSAVGWPALAREAADDYETRYRETLDGAPKTHSMMTTPVVADLIELESRVSHVEKVLGRGATP
ncbi:MAG: hypothetical protein AAFQ82_03820 [Myxococcota bacterium]